MERGVGKEAVVAVLCVLGALALVVAGVARHGADAVREPDARAAFTGGADASTAAAPRPSRAARRARGEPGARRKLAPPGAALVVSVRPGRVIALRERPRGPVVAQLDQSTPFGSRTTFAVVRRRSGWLGVLTSVLPNGRIGWIEDDPAALERSHVRWRLLVDRSARRLSLVRGAREVLSVSVGVGRLGSETPTGTFAVTDKLDGDRFKPAYGCCIVALSGRQPRLPAGWRGGDRLAIHGAPGVAARVRSAGCVTVDEAPLRRLMASVPLGTLVTVRP